MQAHPAAVTVRGLHAVGQRARRSLEFVLPRLARWDDALAQQHLSACEWHYFSQMHPADRKHGLQVAAAILELQPHYADQPASPLLRAAILHDVGKSQVLQGGWRHWQVLLRIVFAVIPPASLSYVGLAKLCQRYHEHPGIGAQMLATCNRSTRVAQLIARHHAPQGDAEAVLLARADARF